VRGGAPQSYKQRWFGIKAKPDVLTLERDFWEIVEEGSLSHDVKVLYGNDLPTLHYGSGFPTDAKLDPVHATHPCVHTLGGEVQRVGWGGGCGGGCLNRPS
jgi:hypothetical protein